MGKIDPKTGAWKGDQFPFDDNAAKSGVGHDVKTVRDVDEPLVRFKSQLDDRHAPAGRRTAISTENSPNWMPLSEVMPCVDSKGRLNEEAFRDRFALTHEFEPGKLTHMHVYDPQKVGEPFQVIESSTTRQTQQDGTSYSGGGRQLLLDREPDPRRVDAMLVDSDECREYLCQHKAQLKRNQDREKLAKAGEFPSDHFKTTRDRSH